MARDLLVQTKPERSGVSRGTKVVLVVLVLMATWAACLFGVDFYAAHAGYINIGGLMRGERYDKALAPVDVADLQAVLDKDIAPALETGELAPSTGAGVSIAVVEHGVSRIFSYGTAKPDSIYEIDSITKTFTGLVLSQMVEQGKVQLDEPVSELLPQGTVPKVNGSEITLVDLATQHSGLPRMPDNISPADPANPYAGYRAADLYSFLAKHTLVKPEHAGYLYSNLGFGLLGQALSDRAGIPYGALLEQEVTGPLGLRDTGVTLSPEQQARFLMGHRSDHTPTRAWDLDALAGAGAIRSSAPDMLIYLEANLHPEHLNLASGFSADATLAAALVQSHQLRADTPGGRIGLAWRFEPVSGDYLHDGGSYGYSSEASFNSKQDLAVVVLSNTGIAPKASSSFVDRLARHIRQRLAGQQAISLAN